MYVTTNNVVFLVFKYNRAKQAHTTYNIPLLMQQQISTVQSNIYARILPCGTTTDFAPWRNYSWKKYPGKAVRTGRSTRCNRTRRSRQCEMKGEARERDLAKPQAHWKTYMVIKAKATERGGRSNDTKLIIQFCVSYCSPMREPTLYRPTNLWTFISPYVVPVLIPWPQLECNSKGKDWNQRGILAFFCRFSSTTIKKTKLIWHKIPADFWIRQHITLFTCLHKETQTRWYFKQWKQ